MKIAQIGAKYNYATIPVKNADTVVIPSGVPVCFAYNGTDDGLAVVLPSTALAAGAHTFFAGVLEVAGQTSLGLSQIAQCVVDGLATNAKIILVTRASTTVSFNSYSALTVGQLLQLDTVGNAFLTAATVGATSYVPFAAVAQTLASGASSTSGTGAFSAATAVTAAIKVHLRTM